MMYARIDNGVVAEILRPVEGFEIAKCFHADIVAALVACGPDVEQGWTYDGVAFAAPVTPPVDLVAYAANKRWRVETGGIMVGGMPVATDRESQSLITGAHAYVLANPDVTIKYKSGAGFVELDAPTVTSVATAVAAHVQACFAAEADVVAAIQRGGVLTLDDVDAWPWP